MVPPFCPSRISDLDCHPEGAGSCPDLGVPDHGPPVTSRHPSARPSRRRRALQIEYGLLRDLRVARSATQQQLADLMEVRQASISKFERQDDILVSTLRRYVEALGGRLEVRARFPDHAVVLSRYGSARTAR